MSLLSPIQKGPGIWRNNIKYYSDENLIQSLTRVWETCKNEPSLLSNLPKWWADTKYKLKLSFIEFSKQKAALRRRNWQMMDQGLYNITAAINRDPENQNLLREYNTIKKNLVKTRIKDIKEQMLKSDAQYLMHGDQPTKAFFDKFKNRSEIHTIKSLKNDNGVEVHDIRNILHVAENFYKNLFSGGPIDQNIVELFLREISPLLYLTSDK